MNKFNIFFLGLLLLLGACDIKEEGISDEKIIEVSCPYGAQVITNYTIPFVAKDGAGNDITNKVNFYLDGQLQSSNEILFTQTGTYQVSAQLILDGQTLTGQDYQVNVINPTHSTKIMVEDYTGTWCVNCPRVTYKLEQAVTQNQHIIPVAIHKSRYTGDDPFGFSDIDDLTTHFNISAFPSPILNRVLGNVWDENFSTLQAELDKTQALGLGISSSFSGQQLDVSVKVHFDMDFSSQALSLVVYLIENDLYADQANATQYYNGNNPIVNFRHNHVLRRAVNGVFGHTVPAMQTVTNQEYTFSYSGTISGDVNLHNCDIVAFIVDNKSPAHLVNVQKAAVGDVQDYD